jgi:hypothetical protein
MSSQYVNLVAAIVVLVAAAIPLLQAVGWIPTAAPAERAPTPEQPPAAAARWGTPRKVGWTPLALIALGLLLNILDHGTPALVSTAAGWLYVLIWFLRCSEPIGRPEVVLLLLFSAALALAALSEILLP